ncbi:SPS-sensor component PTR3 [[Candida] zeylanoides]
MDKARSSLESLLRLPPAHEVVADCSVLTCGCLVSESLFASSASTSCPTCSAAGVALLAPVAPLRTLYQILAEGSRRSLSKRDDREGASLLSLFYTFAKEEAEQLDTDAPDENGIAIPPRPAPAAGSTASPRSAQYAGAAGAAGSPSEFSISPLTHSGLPVPAPAPAPAPTSADEQREYNFSKCFPFYRKASAFATHPPKLSLLKKSPKYIASDIHSFTDAAGAEVTRFVLLSASRWSLYQYVAGRPVLVSCGRSTGEYGESPATVAPPSAADVAQEEVVRNDFGEEAAVDDTRRRLAQWDHVHCALSANYLLVAGTRGVMRVLALSGRPLYTYVTDFPIRCVAVAPDESVAACGITARERFSGKEQPFIILHRLASAQSPEPSGAATGAPGGLARIEPITISVPYRDPIKLMRFSASSRHLLCSTVWEARLFIIRLTSGSGDYRKPRLIWSDSSRKRQSVDGHGDEMGEEGLTDVQFDQSHPTLVIASWCSLTPKPPVVIRLDGVQMEGGRHASVGSALADGASAASTGSHADDERHVTSSETIMRVSEVGSAIHRFASSPRGDGMCFVDREGRLYLVSTPNFQLHPSSPMKRVVVQLGEAANAERYQEAASVRFAPDGAKIYVVDRKGLFQVFDFGKGVPGHDGDVVKCKIVM